MSRTSQHNRYQTFWRDPALPFVEVRLVTDGRKVNHTRHWHETFSAGFITGGRSSYANANGGNGEHHSVVEHGTVVVMNPGDVHVCNAIDDGAWSYLMFYLDPGWVGSVQAELRGSAEREFRPYATAAMQAPDLVDAGMRLFGELTDADGDTLGREVGLVEFVGLLDRRLFPGQPAQGASAARIERAAAYIDARVAAPLRLDDLCAEANLSASYLIRAFKKRYGVAPHEYQMNRRIQLAKSLLRQGLPLVRVALEAGFADQAHFQRIFKRLTAATPGQYRADADLTRPRGKARSTPAAQPGCD